jgi:hypothetical protein
MRSFGIVLLLALAVVACTLLVAAARRRSREGKDLRNRIVELVGRARWIHDEASLEVLTATSSRDRLQLVWVDTQRRVDDISVQVAALAATCSRPDTRDELQNLSSTLGRLTGALDTHVSLHLQLSRDPSIETALDGASETVLERRLALSSAIRPLAARI